MEIATQRLTAKHPQQRSDARRDGLGDAGHSFECFFRMGYFCFLLLAKNHKERSRSRAESCSVWDSRKGIEPCSLRRDLEETEALHNSDLPVAHNLKRLLTWRYRVGKCLASVHPPHRRGVHRLLERSGRWSSANLCLKLSVSHCPTRIRFDGEKNAFLFRIFQRDQQSLGNSKTKSSPANSV